MDAIWGAFVPTDSWFGRVEVTDEGLSFRRTSQTTAGSARTRQGTSGSLEPPFAAAPSDDGHCEPRTPGASRDQRLKTRVFKSLCENRTRHLGGVDCVAYARQQLRAASGRLPPLRDGHCEPKRRRKPRPPRRSAVASHQPYTRNAPQRASRHHGGADRVAPARQQLAAGTARPRRHCAAATARSLRLYLTNWELVGKIEVGVFSIFLSGGMFL